MKKGHIIVLVGKSASGKDSVAKILESKLGYEVVLSTTSRPMRSNEVQGVQYNFVSDGDFKKLINEDKLVEYRYYDAMELEKL